MNLEKYHVDWIKSYIEHNIEGNKIFNIRSAQVEVRIPIMDEPLLSSDIFFDLAKKGFGIAYAGVDVPEHPDILQICITSFDDEQDYTIPRKWHHD